MDVRILGPLEVLEEGRPLPLGGPKQRAVLALLVLHANEVVPAERLIDQVWGERVPRTVKAVLLGYVSKLRQGLPPDTLATRGNGYLLRLEPEEIASEVDLLLVIGSENSSSSNRLVEVARAPASSRIRHAPASVLRRGAGRIRSPPPSLFRETAFTQTSS